MRVCRPAFLVSRWEVSHCCGEEDAKGHIESIGVTPRGAGAGKITGNLVLGPQNH